MDTCFGLKGFDKFVSSLHAIDARFILSLRSLDLEVTLSDLQILEHLVIETLLLSLDHLFRLDGKVSFHLLIDLADTLLALSADELDHSLHDEGRLLIVHFNLECLVFDIFYNLKNNS